MPKTITKEQAIVTCNSLIDILQKQIKDLQEHPENVFFGSVKDNIKGWNKAITKHRRDLKHLNSLPDGHIITTY